METLSGKVVVVTGGSAGLGRAIARSFAARGAHVAVIARDAARLESTERELESLRVRAFAVQADVADADSVERAAESIEERLGPIDVWVNNAMATVFSRADQITPEEFTRVTQVTYLGAVYGTLSALRRMRARGYGAIVQVGSALAYRAIPLQSAYCGAKHALRGFTDAVRCELIHDRLPIQVTSVHMPGLNTPQFDWGRSRMPRKAQPVPPIFQPEIGGEAVVWALLHGKREHYVGWPVVKTVVGNKLFPSYADRRAARDAFEPQMTDEPADPDRPGNLFLPVPGDIAAHGRFDARARQRSVVVWLSTHKRQLLLSASLAAAGTALWARMRAA